MAHTRYKNKRVLISEMSAEFPWEATVLSLFYEAGAYSYRVKLDNNTVIDVPRDAICRIEIIENKMKLVK